MINTNELVFGNGQYLITDLNGTMIGSPDKDEQPELKDSPVFQPLLEWLSRRGKIVAITGNDVVRMNKRFLEDIPKELSANGQVLLSSNGGASLYYRNEKGSLIEVEEYRKTALPCGTAFSDEQVLLLKELALNYVNQFFSDLFNNPELISKIPKKYQFLVEIAENRKNEPFTLDELTSSDTKQAPRIEIRTVFNKNEVVQVAIIGVPAELEISLDPILLEQIGRIGSPPSVIRMGFTTQIMVKGVDKSLVVSWLNHSKQFDLKTSKCIAIGDSPMHNDSSLMKDMYFISVSEKPLSLKNASVYEIGGNCKGTARLIEELVKKGDSLITLKSEEPLLPTHLPEIIRHLA